MFGFDELESIRLGSSGRYRQRILAFKQDGKPLPWIRHYGWWLLHNCVAHFILGLFPCEITFTFHDWTSRGLGHKL